PVPTCRDDRGATKPEPKSGATLRAAGLFSPDVVAHSLQTPEGYARRSRLVWAKNPSPQTWSDLWNGVLSQPAPDAWGAGQNSSLRGQRQRIIPGCMVIEAVFPEVPQAATAA